MSFKKYAQRGREKQAIKNPTPKQIRQKKYDRAAFVRNRKYVLDEIERRGGCQFCGSVLHPKVYQWHHIWDDDPNKKLISDLSVRGSLKNLDIEFKKTVLLCPTCHTIFHQDLCCMFEHKQLHIDGTYYGPQNTEMEKETVSIFNFVS